MGTRWMETYVRSSRLLVDCRKRRDQIHRFISRDVDVRGKCERTLIWFHSEALRDGHKVVTRRLELLDGKWKDVIAKMTSKK